MYASEQEMHRYMDAVEQRLDRDEATARIRELFDRPDNEAPVEAWLAFIATTPISSGQEKSATIDKSNFQLGITEFTEFFRARTIVS